MKLIITTILILVLSIQSNAQWIELNSGTNEWLRGVWFINNDEGLAVGYNGKILKTEDGGETWIDVNSNTTSNLFSVFFANDEIGYITGGNGIILKTEDRGNSWATIHEGFGTLHESYFVTPEIGYIAGESGNILKTIDGGENWTTLQLGSFNGKVSVFFNNENVGYFVGIGDNDAIMKTENGGDSFEGLYSGTTVEFSSIFFTNLEKGYACSTTDPTKIVKTIDGGENWEEDEINIDQGLYAIKFIDENIGYVVGGFPDDNIIFRTENGGEDWIEENSNSNEPLFDIYMLSENYAFAVGRNGTILKLGEAVSIAKLNNRLIEVYPNPSDNYISISVNNTEQEQFDYILSTIDGKKMKSGKISNNEDIDINELNIGVYLLRIKTDRHVKSIKLIKK